MHGLLIRLLYLGILASLPLNAENSLRKEADKLQSILDGMEKRGFEMTPENNIAAAWLMWCTETNSTISPRLIPKKLDDFKEIATVLNDSDFAKRNYKNYNSVAAALTTCEWGYGNNKYKSAERMVDALGKKQAKFVEEYPSFEKNPYVITAAALTIRYRRNSDVREVIRMYEAMKKLDYRGNASTFAAAARLATCNSNAYEEWVKTLEHVKKAMRSIAPQKEIRWRPHFEEPIIIAQVLCASVWCMNASKATTEEERNIEGIRKGVSLLMDKLWVLGDLGFRNIYSNVMMGALLPCPKIVGNNCER